MEWLARRKAAFGGLQGRLQGHHLSKFDKKNFKEAFITDKSRFPKRQSKYNRSKIYSSLWRITFTALDPDLKQRG